MKKWILLLTIALASLAVTVLVSACGGFFCTNTPIDQSAERIIFTVNGDGTITTTVGINYQGAAEDFSWILPVPSIPELGVGNVFSMNTLQQLTEPRFVQPPNYCRNIFGYYGRGGGGGDAMFVEEGQVGPYDFAILGSEDATEVLNWLRENGYRVEETMEPLLDIYVDEGMFFVAMKLSQDSDVGDIQPIKLTYSAEHPSIPIRLTAVAAVEDMPILVWIFADTQYTTENFANPSPNMGAYQALHQVNEVGNFPQFKEFDFDADLGIFVTRVQEFYWGERDRLQAEYDGKAFITEFAGPSNELAERNGGNLGGDPTLQPLIEQFSYVTRLRAQMSPAQMTLDPVFVPAPDKSDLLVFDLSEDVDPLHYWGCSSRSLVESDIFDTLPAGRTQLPFDDVPSEIAHPDDWQLSEFISQADNKDHQFFVFAPQAVTSNDVAEAMRGNSDTPMLVISPKPGGSSNISQLLYFQNGVYDVEFRASPESYQETNSVVLRPFTHEDISGGYLLAIFTTDDDWRANQAMYTAMARYPRSYEYYLDDDLRHTLMFGVPSWQSVQHYAYPSMFAYPDGWIERLDEDGVLIVEPKDESMPAEIRLLAPAMFGYFQTDGAELMVADVLAQYNVEDANIEGIQVALMSCEPDHSPTVTFQNEDTQGVIAFNRYHALVITSQDNTISPDLMQSIADTFFAPTVDAFSYLECQQ